MLQTFAVGMNYSLADMLSALGMSLSTAHSENALLHLQLAQIAPILPYLLLVLVLIFRPRGLLGAREV